MIKRVILGIFAILSVFFLPWWLVLLISLALLFYLDRFYEVIVIAIVADVIYGSIYSVGFTYPITLFSIILLFVISAFKKNLISY